MINTSHTSNSRYMIFIQPESFTITKHLQKSSGWKEVVHSNDEFKTCSFKSVSLQRMVILNPCDDLDNITNLIKFGIGTERNSPEAADLVRGLGFESYLAVTYASVDNIPYLIFNISSLSRSVVVNFGGCLSPSGVHFDRAHAAVMHFNEWRPRYNLQNSGKANNNIITKQAVYPS